MLVIRMQRTGRKGHAMFRMVVQDSRVTPTSGKVVAQLGSYDPHAKTVTIAQDKAVFYLEHGAQPSPRAARLLTAEGVKLPDWVKLPAADKTRTVRNADKRRSTTPPAPKEAAPTETETAAAPAPETVEEAPAEESEAPIAEPAETVAEPDSPADTTSEPAKTT